MNCPRCTTPVLVEKERDGVLVDGCPECRGLWLDRGELEKLVHRALRELEEAEAYGRAPRLEPGRPVPSAADRPAGDFYRDSRYRRRDDDDDDDDRDRNWSGGRDGYRDGRPPRKRSFLESIGDIFD